MIKTAGKEFRPMILGNIPGARRLLRAVHAPKPILIERTIDPTLLALNKSGYLNGHTPFSAYLAFLSTLVAELFDYDTIAVANERSANEPTLFAHDKAVNHQYSKSYEFERDFRNYARAYLTKRTQYLSVLRPLYEIQIAHIAARWPEMLKSSVSCNVGQHKGKWCAKCSKCMTVFLLLYPFMKTEALVKIFKKNMLNNHKLWRLIPPLVGKGPKPFDCVATKREMQAALSLSLKKAKNEKEEPALLTRYSRELAPRIKINPAEMQNLRTAWDKNNFVPKDIAGIIKKNLGI
jgi:hypothetical protein